jgi:hypothetical protein
VYFIQEKANMKKLNLLVFIFLLVFSFKTSGDVILIESPRAQICVRISNLDEFPDVALIGFSDCVSLSQSNKIYLINSISCLKVNKYCPLTILAVKKDYIKNKDITKIDWNNDKNVFKSHLKIDPDWRIEAPESVSNIDVYFRIAGFTDSSIVLYRSLQVYKYNNGQPDKIEDYKYNGDFSKLYKNIK